MKIQVAISKKPISVDRAIKAVLSPSAGGSAVFIGSVRNRSEGIRVSGIEMDAAEELARKDLVRIAKSATAKFDICRLNIQHRIGMMNVGDVIVVIAVSAPHRKDSFAACMFVIDELKKTTPIWKKEIGRGKARWVGSEG